MLAGGRSSRFGSDKALAQWRGMALIDHAVAALGAHVDAVVVCGREMMDGSGIADRPAPDLGPLGGLNAALHHAAERGFQGVLTTGCDMPLFPAGLAEALIGGGAAYLDGQQLVGYWPTSLAGALDAHLAAGGSRSIRGWLEAIEARPVPHTPLPNVNQPEDLAKLIASAPRNPPPPGGGGAEGVGGGGLTESSNAPFTAPSVSLRLTPPPGGGG